MVLEHGDVQFVFQPTVQPADAREVELGIQAFFMILSPAGRPTHRRVRVGRKRMPATARERFWARVERVGSLQRVLGDMLEDEHYATKTRGDRYQPGARPIAHGTYELVQHEDHVHLRYQVEPFGFEEAPEEIQLAEQGDHVVLFKRPPEGGAVWTHTGSIEQLDLEGAELVLVGPGHTARDSPAELPAPN
jgi:hypothetical protein